MPRSETQWIDWLTGRLRTNDPRLLLGIGDDMSMVTVEGGRLLTTSDLLADGVHFDTRSASYADIGHKCIACSLSDCAAMAVCPLAATVSVALPRGLPEADLESLFDGLLRTAEAFACPVAGGDTIAWDHPLVVDVTITAVPYPGIEPVRRSGARVGDVLCVTGRLGGSRLGRHLVFTPRVHEARRLAESLGPDLHALMDLSDGLSLDLHRLCRASGVGACLEERRLLAVAGDDAQETARRDGRSLREHVLDDGEDFELLAAVAESCAEVAALVRLGLTPIGRVTEAADGVVLEGGDGTRRPLTPGGFQHRL